MSRRQALQEFPWAREREDYEEKEMLEEVPLPGTPKDEWVGTEKSVVKDS